MVSAGGFPLGVERHAPLAEPGLVPIPDALEQLVNRHVLFAPASATTLEAGELEQVADDVFQPFGLVSDDVEIATPGVLGERHLSHAERLDVAPDCRERCGQLVGDVGEELASGAVRTFERLRPLFELAGHLVEAVRQE